MVSYLLHAFLVQNENKLYVYYILLLIHDPKGSLNKLQNILSNLFHTATTGCIFNFIQVHTEYEKQKDTKSWSRVLSEVRLDFIERRATEAKNDLLVYLLVNVFDRYKAETENRNQTELMSSFIQMVSHLLKQIFENGKMKQ